MNNIPVVALDIGGSYTSYAFVEGEDGRQTVRRYPTRALLSSDEIVQHFGEDAEDEYFKLSSEEKKDIFYFGSFCNYLDQKSFKGLQSSTSIRDINGRKVPLFNLIKATIAFLKSDADRVALENSISLAGSKWLFVVPVSWDQKPKQIIRSAAISAGIDRDDVEFALDSEAGAMYCQGQFPMSQQRSKILICDIEDCDMKGWIYVKKQDGSLEETASDFEVDSHVISIESCIRAFMDKLIGKSVLAKIKLASRSVYELYASHVDHIEKFNDREGILVRISEELKELYRIETKSDLSSRVSSFSKERAELVPGHILIRTSILMEICDSYLRTMSFWLSGVLRNRNAADIDRIYITGRNASFLFVQDHIQRQLNGKITWTPAAENAKLSGTLIYWFQGKQQIKKRKLRFSFGIVHSPVFNPVAHDATHAKVDDDGVKRCADVFLALVEKGDLVGVHECVQRTFRPQESMATSEVIDIYQSVNQSTKYVTDEGCDYLGRVKIQLLGKSIVSNKDFNVKMCFSGTEIQMKAIDRVTNEEYERVFQCM